MTTRFLLNGSMCSLFIFESVFLQLFEERAVILVLNQDLGKLIFVHARYAESLIQYFR